MKFPRIGSMKPTKKCLINQPAGIGDILFIQKIVSRLSEEYQVYLPVKESISWLADYVSTTCLEEDCKSLQFDKVLRLDGASIPGYKIMESKYRLAGILFDDYVSYIDIKRNKQKEEDLFNLISPKKSYRLVCPWFGTPQQGSLSMLKMDIPISDELENVVMNIEEGYTLFDWLKIIQEADEIYTTDSAIMFLIEKFDCKAKTLVAYSRRKDASEVDYLFTKDWRYANGN